MILLKRRSLVKALLACALALCLFPGAAIGEAERSIVTTESWDFSDGFYCAYTPDHSTYGITYWLRNFYDTLVLREGDEIVPSLAESWEISEDGKSYTFHLRKGVLFSDGAELTAEAVKTSLMASIQNMGMYIVGFGKVGTLLTSIDTPDESTVVLRLSAPYYGVLSDLAMCNPMGIVSPNAFHDDLTPVETPMQQTMGTGPYMYVGESDGNSYTFVRNPNYWGDAPDVDRFTVKVIADNDAKVLALRSGEIDLIPGAYRMSYDAYTDLSAADGIATTLDEQISNSRFIGFNTQKAPFDSADVRRAVAYAVDTELLSTAIFAGIETPADQFLSRALPYCDVETAAYGFHPDKAKELLEGAGWVDADGDGVREKDGQKLSVTLDYFQNTTALDGAALTIAQELKDVGFEVALRSADTVTWFNTIFSGEYDFSLHTTYGGYYDPYLTMINMNPDMMSDPLLAQAAFALEGGKDVIVELESTADMDRVQEIYREILTTTAEQAIFVPISYVHQYAAFNAEKIASFSFGGDPLFIEIKNVEMP